MIASAASYPLSPLQQGMLFHHLLEPRAGVDIEQLVLSLPEPIDAVALHAAWNAAAAHHEVLRTSFRWEGVERPRQEIASAVRVPFREEDLRAHAPAEQAARIAAYLREDRGAGFALDAPPLFRVTLLRTADKGYELLWTFHHALMDGRSFAFVLRDVFACYESATRGEPCALAQARPYRDYIAWLGTRDFGDAESFWRERLRGFEAPTPLPMADPGHTLAEGTGRQRDRELSLAPAVTAALERLAHGAGVTLTTLVQAAWAIVLARHSGEPDIIFGATRACRASSVADLGRSLPDPERPERQVTFSRSPASRIAAEPRDSMAHGSFEGADAMVGLFINTLPLRVNVREDARLGTWLRELRAHWTELREVETTPLPLVQSCSSVADDAGLFESIVVFENRTLEATLRELGGAWQQRRVRLYEQTNYPLTVAAYGGAQLRLRLQYDGARFDDASMERVLGHLATILEGMAAGGVEQRVGDVPWVTPAEQQQLAAWSRPRAAHHSGATLADLFARQVARAPHATAVIDQNESLTYRDLDERAERLAQRLRRGGVEPGGGVGLCLERSLEVVVAIVAVYKAGGFYVPLDPAYPRERLSFMLADAMPQVVLTTSALRARLPSCAASVLLFDDDAQPADEAQPSRVRRPKADDLAYIIYTSGSTGTPKGVMVTHRNVVRLLTATQPEFAFGQHDVLTLFHSYAFDFSVWEIWGALAYGGRLVVVPYWVSRSPEDFHALLVRESVTVLNQTPSAFRALLQFEAAQLLRLGALRLVIFGGEALEVETLAPWFSRYGDAQPQLVNMYGITETTVHVTLRRLRASDAEGRVRSPIGHALDDLHIHVLDARGKPVPVGVAGELYVGGAGVARGYFKRPELTAQRFVPDPESDNRSARLYRSGDMVRRLPNGDLAFVGRTDEQLKIRGFRVEPGEIEAALREHPDVKDCVVVGREFAPGERRLIAYVEPHDAQLAQRHDEPRPQRDEPTAEHVAAIASEALRTFLAERLPPQLVPAQFVAVAALPLTPNGKIDRRHLPAPEEAPSNEPVQHAAPSTPVERTLVSIWSAALGTKDIGVTDNFFALGGDSIVTITVVARARDAGLRITPRQLFEHPTIAALARVAASVQPDAHEAEQTPAGTRARRPSDDVASSTPIQRWFFEAQSDEPNYWNQAFLLDVPADFDTAHASAAACAVVLQHDALRARFERRADGWTAAPGPQNERVYVERADLAKVSAALRPAMIESLCTAAQGSLDIARGPLVRFVHIALGNNRPGRLLIAVHHLAVDGVSWIVLLEHFERAYRAAERGENAALPPQTTSFAEWAQCLERFARSEQVALQAAYWNEVATSPSLPLPLAGDRRPRGGDRVIERDPHEGVIERDSVVHRGSRDSESEREAAAQTLTVRLTDAGTRALLGPVPLAYGARINDVLLAALTCALASWLGDGSIVVDVEGHGREDVIEGLDLTRTVGWFTTIFPVRLELGRATPRAALQALAPRLGAIPQRGLGYGLLRYLANGAPPVAASPAEIVFNYLGRFDRIIADSSLFTFARESTGPWHGPRSLRRHRLEVNSLVARGRFEARWTFSRNAHDTTTIERLAAEFVTALRRLIAGAERPAHEQNDVADVYPLSPMQRLHLLADANDDPGFEQWRYRVRGPLDAAALRRAWQAVVDRHAILRTAFEFEGVGEPRQVVHRHVALPWDDLDWRALSAAERARSLDALLRADRTRGFTFDRAPLMRCTLVRTADDAHELIWSQHHLLLDRWSWPLVLADVATFYAAFSRGTIPALPPPPAFAGYVRWTQTQDIAAAETFWRALFAGYHAPPPFGRRVAAARGDGTCDGKCESDGDAPDELRFDLTAAQTDELRAFSRSAGLSANALVAGAWALWLGRATETDDVVFGVATSGRGADVPGIEHIVGVTTNNLPYRVKLDATAQLGPWLRSLHAQSLDIGQYAFSAASDVQRWSGVPWRLRLFETLLIFHDAGADARTERWLGPEVRIERVAAATRTGYPLSLVVADGDRLSLRATYDPAYFDAEAIGAALRSVSAVLVAMAQNPPRPLGDLLATIPALAPAAMTAAPVDRLRTYSAPASAAERVIAGIWSELLGLERVGSNDNFFELGGQSLLAMQLVTRLRETFRLDVPIRAPFTAPTVAALASALGSLELQPGQVERIAAVVERVAAMSSDELQAFTRAAEGPG